MVASTNAEVRALNDGARAMLKAEGKIKDAQEIETAHGRGEFAAGERIVFTGTDKPRGIFNSTMATIEKVNAKEMQVKTDSGEKIAFKPEEMNKFRHAYAITAHKSQGDTFDKSLVMVDGYNTDREKLYVEFSRGRQGNQIFADKPTIGELSREEAQKLRSLPAEERPAAEHQMFKGHLGKMVGTSHMKDTTQSYEPGRTKTQEPERSPILERFNEGRGQLAAKWNEIERQSREQPAKELSVERGLSPQTEKSLDHERDRGRGHER